MTKEEFNEIVKIPSKSLWGSHSINVERYRFNSKEFHNWVIRDLNYKGNGIFTNEEGDINLQEMYTSKVFTEKEWDSLLPHIFYRDFNKDFDKLVEKVLPLFNRIPQYWNDLHLEIWQGIFSFGTHWRTEGLSLRESINKPENGELYCNTLLEIYPIFEEFIIKWEDQRFLYRFCEAVGPDRYKGLLCQPPTS